ncbi:hypothetical protein O5D80_006983 [Batrachochytrium dendrobatidis]|nr:hypothetical protein O5D80_006983 [Batrachochytrium dendrobatidis]
MLLSTLIYNIPAVVYQLDLSYFPLYNITLFSMIRQAWDRILQDPLLSTDYLRDKGMAGAIGNDDLRSLYWKIYLDIVPGISTEAWRLVLEKERRGYVDLKEKYIFDPTKLKEAADWSLNNPLSLAEDSPWKQYFTDVELRKLILQDVERTLPDQELFRNTAIQTVLCNILFIWCKLNPDVSYRQGMHELLAIVFIVVDRDKVTNPTSSSEEDAFHTMFSANHVEHDTATIFFRLMRGVRSWYEVQEDQPQFVRPNDKKGAQQAKTVPIITACRRIQNELLTSLDPDLARHMEKHGIEPQLYGLRWLRLLFAREFTLSNTFILWDGLLADDAAVTLAEWVAVAMLIYIRDQLLLSDYSGTMHTLMRYPSTADISSSEFISSAKGLRDRFHSKSLRTSLNQLGDDTAPSTTQPSRLRRTHSPWTHFDSATRLNSQSAAVASTGTSNGDVRANLISSTSKVSPLYSKAYTRLLQERDSQLIQDLSSVLERLQYWKKNMALTPSQDIDGLVKMIGQLESVRKSLEQPIQIENHPLFTDMPKHGNNTYDDDAIEVRSRANSSGSLKTDRAPDFASTANVPANQFGEEKLSAIPKSSHVVADNIHSSTLHQRRISNQSVSPTSSKLPMNSTTFFQSQSVDLGFVNHGCELSQKPPLFESFRQGAFIPMSAHITDNSSSRLTQGADMVFGQVKAGLAGVNKAFSGLFEDSLSASSSQSARAIAQHPDISSASHTENYRDVNYSSRSSSPFSGKPIFRGSVGSPFLSAATATTIPHNNSTVSSSTVTLKSPMRAQPAGDRSNMYPPMKSVFQSKDSSDPLGVGVVSSKPSGNIK